MGSKESKIEETLSLKDLPQFFRDFAVRVENALRETDESREDDLADFSKIRIRIKRVGTHVDVRVKVKRESPDNRTPTGPISKSPGAGKVSYKKLKKRMDRTFESFSHNFESGLIPAAATLESFQHDARQMVTYADKGQPYYEEFTKACTDFLDAWEKGDVSAAQGYYARLDDLKKACHDRFK